jgi:hypothetical protein
MAVRHSLRTGSAGATAAWLLTALLAGGCDTDEQVTQPELALNAQIVAVDAARGEVLDVDETAEDAAQVAETASAGNLDVSEVPDTIPDIASAPDDGTATYPSDGAADIDADESDGALDGDTEKTDGGCTTAVNCQGALPLCHQWACASGLCVAKPAPAMTPCDDGSSCTTADACDSGNCFGKPTECDDGLPCTVDTCSEATGQCASQPTTAPCDDGDACTSGETCGNGACGGGIPTNCDDQNPCTDDACEPKSGCGHALNANPCSGLDKCVVGATCAGGSCGGGTAKTCDDGNPCTQDACDPANGTCTAKNTASFCSDGDPCTVGDVCNGGQCQKGAAMVCDDGNPCTQDSCFASGLGAACTATAADGVCDDGDACTAGDVCKGGSCKANGVKACDDGNPCTDDACDPAKGCTAAANVAACTIPGNACVQGVCAGGTCKAGGQLGCDDANPCTQDACDSGKGCTHLALPDATTCSDANACKAATTCSGGKCASGVAMDCDDGTACTKDACDPKLGCVWTPLAGPCEDGDKCTAGDACQPNGLCGKGQPVNPATMCDDGNFCTADACDSKVGCVHLATAATCSDGSPCTSGEACQGGACVGGKAAQCDDGKPCTTDGCDPATGVCVWTAAGGACEDGDPCTVGDMCKGANCVTGAKKLCNDGEGCTVDTCDPKTGACVAAPKPGAAVPPCDGSKVGDRCMKAFKVASSTWADAEKACIAWGGHLARVGSGEENTAVRALGNAVCGNQQLWIGLNDLETEGKFVWTDGGAVTFTKWVPGEPNNCDGCCGAPEDVVHMHANGTWNDICLNWKLPCRVCQRPLPALPCTDANVCTQADVCVAGKCQGLPVSCDDQNPCTQDVCDKGKGCQSTPLADKTPCGQGMQCKGGKCLKG